MKTPTIHDRDGALTVVITRRTKTGLVIPFQSDIPRDTPPVYWAARLQNENTSYLFENSTICTSGNF